MYWLLLLQSMYFLFYFTQFYRAFLNVGLSNGLVALLFKNYINPVRRTTPRNKTTITWNFNQRFILAQQVKPSVQQHKLLIPRPGLLVNNYMPFFLKLLHTFLLVNVTITKIHFYNIAFFLETGQVGGGVSIVKANYDQFYKQFRSVSKLLQNLFLFDVKMQSFATGFFQREVLALNRTWNPVLLSSWNYINKNFYRLQSCYAQSLRNLLRFLKKQQINVFLITDIIGLKKFSYVFKQLGLYAFAPISVSLNPWQVFYPIIVGSVTLTTQLFFLNLFFIIYRTIAFSQYIYLYQYITTWYLKKLAS